MRSVMMGIGMTLHGGEAYVNYKPNLFDDDGNIGDGRPPQKFLARLRRSLRDAGW